MILEKNIAKVEMWGTKNLSYAGRTQLVNAVLLHIQTYWASMFLLSRVMLRKIVALCRNFIWIAKIHTNNPPLIAWESVHRVKKEGGVGLNDCVS